MCLPKNTLVTGGSGLLGRYVISELSSDCIITNFDRSIGNSDSKNIKGDVLDYHSVIDAAQDQDAIVHLAGIDLAVEAPDNEIFQTNVQGTWNILHAAEQAKVGKVVLCSSVAALGFKLSPPAFAPKYLPVDEFHPGKPCTTYGLSKMLVERIGKTFANRGKLTVISLRPALIAFPHLIKDIDIVAKSSDRCEDSLHSPSDTEASGLSILRAYVSPKDCAKGFRRALEAVTKPYDCFNLTANDTFTSLPTLDVFKKQFMQLPSCFDENLYSDNPMASGYDNKRAKQLLNWSPNGIWSDLLQSHT